MRYFRIYTGPDGHSRFEDVDVPSVSASGGGSALGAPIPVIGVVFARFAPGFSRGPHVAPRRQFVVTLAGTGEVVTASGETRRLETGSVMLAEDTTGSGHSTRNTGDGDWLTLWLPLEGETYAPPAGEAVSAAPVAGYVRIHPTADGGSAFEEVTLAPAGGGADISVSEIIPATSVIFRRSPADYDIDYHNAPRRQFVINLSGAVEIVASDGQSRRLGPGELLCAEDVTGKGHISRNAGEGERLSLFVPLAG